MEAQKKGVEELVAVLDLAQVLSIKLLLAAKDGVGLDDLKILFDGEIWAKAKQAMEGLDQVGPELQDLDFAEGSELASKAIGMVKAIVDVIQAPKA